MYHKYPTCTASRCFCNEKVEKYSYRGYTHDSTLDIVCSMKYFFIVSTIIFQWIVMHTASIYASGAWTALSTALTDACIDSGWAISNNWCQCPTGQETDTYFPFACVPACVDGAVRLYNGQTASCANTIQCGGNDFPSTQSDEMGRPTSQICLSQDSPDRGIQCSTTQFMNGTCTFNYENSLGIRQSNPNTTPTELVQDVVLTATTFIGTILTVALIVSGLMLVFGGANENTASKGRSGIKYALIGYVVVLVSYAIVRLVQFMVSG
jgi:hypothetical protein